MCNFWKREKVDEIKLLEWKKFLDEMKKWNKNAHIQFSGGEPFVKRYAIDVFEHCSKIKLSYGITTNLTLFPLGGVERVVNADPFNVNVSLDGMSSETHDYCRGVHGSFVNVVNNMDLLVNEISKQKKNIRVIIKTIIMNQNLDELEDMVHYAKEKSVAINFQPIYTCPDTSSEEFWVTDIKKVEEVSKVLISMRNSGYPILTPERDLKVLSNYFKEEITLKQHYGKCNVGIKNFDILPNGDVFLCRTIKSKIGNIVNEKPSNIWNSDLSKKERTRIENCKKICLSACQTRRTLKDLFIAFRNLR